MAAAAVTVANVTYDGIHLYVVGASASGQHQETTEKKTNSIKYTKETIPWQWAGLSCKGRWERGGAGVGQYPPPNPPAFRHEVYVCVCRESELLNSHSSSTPAETCDILVHWERNHGSLEPRHQANGVMTQVTPPTLLLQALSHHWHH